MFAPNDSLAVALATAGRLPEVRQLFVAACLALEELPEHRATAIRDEVTGPIVDALHADVGVIRKQLSNGLLFDFLYRSKIARDFVLSVPSKPDHVWEPQTTKTLLHFARRASHVVAGGAYFGDQVIPIAHAMRSSGGVCHAFEPDREQAAMLAHNAQLNGLDNVRVHVAALWGDARTTLRLEGVDALASAVPADAEAEFETITIDAYLDGEGVDAAEVIMLDLEGGELEALSGAAHHLSMVADRAPVVVFEIHRQYVDWSRGLLATDVAKLLTGCGYSLLAIRDFQSNRPMGDRPVELVTAESVYLEGPAHGFNVLAVKDAAVLGHDRFRICSGVSPKLLVHGDPALHHPLGGL